jgi:ribonuclease-3
MNPPGILTRLFRKGFLLRSAPKDKVAALQRATGIQFSNPDILRQALTHRSYLHENSGKSADANGRMEFLGDSVLGLVANEFLYRRYPLAEEGELTKMKSLLVSKAVLARRGRAMRLGQFLFLSEAEEESGGRERTSIIADSFEAVIGAIYLDRGLDEAGRFIHEQLLRHASKIIQDSKHRNYKSILQEYVQGEFRVHPHYRLLSEHGPEHEKLFTIEVSVKKKALGSGTGKNKKEAEQSAARDALSKLELLGKQ